MNKQETIKEQNNDTAENNSPQMDKENFSHIPVVSGSESNEGLSKENNQPCLFDIENEYEKHWKNMPEFKQNKIKEYASVIIRFENESDLIEFSKIINQKLTKKTKSIWFPFKSHFRNIKKEWI